jgi:hypothetical protein
MAGTATTVIGTGGQALSLDARFDRLLSAAATLAEQARGVEAEPLLRLALRLRPGVAVIVNRLGTVLFDHGRVEDALACFQHAAALAPCSAGPWANCGMTLKTLDRFDEAIASYNRAVEIDPSDGQVRLNRAVALLRAGRMVEAWPDYEQRLLIQCHGPWLDRLLPTLTADGPDLTGRSVLVMHEEGFGDTLQFIRYTELLAARGARVCVAAPPELASVLQTVSGIHSIIEGNAAATGFDYVCPTFSLPRALATDLSTVPCRVPYVSADARLVAHWGTAIRWRDPERLRIGLVWAGQARPWLPGFTALDSRRSAGLASLAPLAALDAEFVSLQKGAPTNFDSWPGPPLHNPMSDVRNFADTAALIQHLDVVVSVDTAVVHLAGAMGKPVLMIDRYDSCWRWLSGRTDSPWYPTVQIFRQSQPGMWHGVIDAVMRELAMMVVERGRGQQKIVRVVE